MLYREIIAVCSEIRKKTNEYSVLAEPRVLNIQPGGS
jgi:hypothetical protein